MNNIVVAPSRQWTGWSMMTPSALRYLRPGILRNTIATWSERSRYRWKLRQLAQEPHLIEDIGLTRLQVHSELSKRLWEE